MLRIITFVLSMALMTIASADDSQATDAATVAAVNHSNDTHASPVASKGQLRVAAAVESNSDNMAAAVVASDNVSGSSFENHLGIGFAHGIGSRVGPLSGNGSTSTTSPIGLVGGLGGVVGGDPDEDRGDLIIGPGYPGPQPCPTFNRDLGGGDCDPSPSK